MAWAAGFIDGEGTFGAQKSPVATYLSVPQAGSDEWPPDTLLRLKELLPEASLTISKQREGARKPVWLFRLTQRAAVDAALNELSEFLSYEKLHQAALMHDFYLSNHRPRGWHVTAAAKQRTHCSQGHSYAEHGRKDSQGRRQCAECHRAYQRDWYHRNKNRTTEVQA